MTDKNYSPFQRFIKIILILFFSVITFAFCKEGYWYVSTIVDCQIPKYYSEADIAGAYEPGFLKWAHKTYLLEIDSSDFWIIHGLYRFECLTIYKNIYPLYARRHNGGLDHWVRGHAKRMYSPENGHY